MRSLAMKSQGMEGCVSAVVLLQDDSDSSTLYDAAIEAAGVLQGRVPLILEGRPDVASACEAKGVYLERNDIPIVAARRILSDDGSLVLKTIASGEEARKSAEEGASGLVLTDWNAIDDVKSGQRGAASIPVFADLSSERAQDARGNQEEEVDGLIGTLEQLKAYHEEVGASGNATSRVDAMLMNFFDPKSDSNEDGPSDAVSGSPQSGTQRSAAASGEGGGTGAGEGVQTRSTKLRADVHDALVDLRGLLKDKAPRLIDGVDGNAESLLTSALKALDDPALLVCVGEFNSGKSSVINAFLGQSLLPVGVVPTTNEVSLLKYGEEDAMAQEEDGTFVRAVPCEALRDLTIVDTPGTNVVVERQQKLTEDFIPKADMVMFVLSADRPLTESETRFMSFIRRWGKKIVFAVNKKDMLTPDELEEVCAFVQQNASQILGVEKSPVFPVSARLALGLARDTSQWEESGFRSLVQVVEATMAEGDDGMRLKLNTGLSLGQSLLSALKEQIDVQAKALDREGKALASIPKQLAKFKREMQKDASIQYSNVERVLDNAMKATDELTDSLLSLGNTEAISNYVLNAKSMQVTDTSGFDVLRNFETGLKDLVAEHEAWLDENCGRQGEYYVGVAKEKAVFIANMGLGAVDASGPLAEGQYQPAPVTMADLEPTAKKYLPPFSPQLLSDRLESSIQEAATASFGTAGAAIVGTIVLTFLLNSIQEDLLAVAFGGSTAYLSVLSIPLQRAKVKGIFKSKVKGEIDALVGAMRGDLDAALSRLNEGVEAAILPLEDELRAKQASLTLLQAQQAAMEAAMDNLADQMSLEQAASTTDVAVVGGADATLADAVEP